MKRCWDREVNSKKLRLKCSVLKSKIFSWAWFQTSETFCMYHNVIYRRTGYLKMIPNYILRSPISAAELHYMHVKYLAISIFADVSYPTYHKN
jgi:hypothetical protein